MPESQQSVVADDESEELLFPSDGDGDAAASPLGIGVYIRMILVLAVVVALIYVLFRFIKANTRGDSLLSDDTYLRRVASLSLGTGKSVQVVTLVDNAYLIGVSDNSVNLISIIEDKELINAMNLSADKRDKVSRPKSFSDVLELFMPSASRRKQGNVFESKEADDILAALNTQRQRLNEVED